MNIKLLILPILSFLTLTILASEGQSADCKKKCSINFGGTYESHLKCVETCLTKRAELEETEEFSETEYVTPPTRPNTPVQ